MKIAASARATASVTRRSAMRVANAIRGVETDDGLFVVGANPTGRVLELVARPTEASELLVFHAMAPATRQRQEVSAMTDNHARSGEPDQSLAERSAAMSVAEIDAMSDQEAAELMGATPEEFATQPAWTWRQAAKAATDEYADRLAADVDSGRAAGITDRSEIRPRLGGRPRVGGAGGRGPSTQVRVRVTTRTGSALEAIAATPGRRLADVSREALDEYAARHLRSAQRSRRRLTGSRSSTGMATRPSRHGYLRSRSSGRLRR